MAPREYPVANSHINLPINLLDPNLNAYMYGPISQYSWNY